MATLPQFGEIVDGYEIPVLNQREIRAAAGIIFFIMFIAIAQASMLGHFTLIKFGITIFFSDLLVRVFISPKYAPTMIAGRFFVRNQQPEYVGASQKRFAWIIGLLLSGTIMVHLVIGNSFSPISGLGCTICLALLFFETAFGICLGCKVYGWIYKNKVQYCPGEVCKTAQRHAIQRIEGKQIVTALAFVAYAVVVALAFTEAFTATPYDLLGLTEKFK